MGFETILFTALVGLQAVSQIRSSKEKAEVVTENTGSKARALKTEGDLAIKERTKALRLRAARQTSSFLSSGLTLEGTPSVVLDETFETGIADIKNIGKGFQTNIDNIIKAGNAQSKSIISQGRTEAIGTIASGFSNASFGNLFGGGSGEPTDITSTASFNPTAGGATLTGGFT